MSAALGQVIALLELLLAEIAGHHRSAGSIHPVGEVLAGEANPSPFPVLKLPWVDVLPLVHSPLNAVLMYYCIQCCGVKRFQQSFRSAPCSISCSGDVSLVLMLHGECVQGAGSVLAGETGGFFRTAVISFDGCKLSPDEHPFVRINCPDARRCDS